MCEPLELHCMAAIDRLKPWVVFCLLLSISSSFLAILNLSNSGHNSILVVARRFVLCQHYATSLLELDRILCARACVAVWAYFAVVNHVGDTLSIRLAYFLQCFPKICVPIL